MRTRLRLANDQCNGSMCDQKVDVTKKWAWPSQIFPHALHTTPFDFTASSASYASAIESDTRELVSMVMH